MYLLVPVNVEGDNNDRVYRYIICGIGLAKKKYSDTRCQLSEYSRFVGTVLCIR